MIARSPPGGRRCTGCSTRSRSSNSPLLLARASQPMPTTLGTLDAIHLATALLWAEHSRLPLVMATHDQSLATAARASGLRVIG